MAGGQMAGELMTGDQMAGELMSYQTIKINLFFKKLRFF
jgi:hypothetical protein